MSTHDSPESAYRAAGLTDTEIGAVAALAGYAGAADPLAHYVAVPLPAVRTVLGVVDRLCDPGGAMIGDYVFGRQPSAYPGAGPADGMAVVSIF